MSGLRILLTAFGPFPGAPYNPTITLVDRLMRLRRPAFGEVVLASHIFEVSYAAVDRELPQIIEQHHPHAMLMFGLATRTSYVRIETRARNAVTMLWPDAAHSRVRKGTISGTLPAQSFGPHTRALLRAAQLTGIDARASRDAGSYLCNYLSWRAIEACAEAGHSQCLAAFVHIPLIARDGASGPHTAITMEGMTDAGEAMLMEMIRAARHLQRRTGNPNERSLPAA